MEENRAPENMYIPQKIYLSYKAGKVIGLVKKTGVSYKSGVDGNIEYTRTDAFIEKAKKWLMENVEKHISADGEYTVYYNEMFEDFKKYMER